MGTSKRPGGRHVVMAHLEHTAARPEAELRAATRAVKQLVGRADAQDQGAPLWRGWAVHEAFLNGVTWSREHIQERLKEE